MDGVRRRRRPVGASRGRELTSWRRVFACCLHRCIVVACELTLTMCAGPITGGRCSAAPSDDELYGYLARTTSTGRPVKQGGCERKQALPPMFAMWTRHAHNTGCELQINRALISQWQLHSPRCLLYKYMIHRNLVNDRHCAEFGREKKTI